MTMGFQDNPNNILGADTSNNQYSSTNVGSNADGSMIERLEYIQTQIAAVSSGQVLVWGLAPAGTSSTTDIVIAALAGYGNDFFNNQFYMQVLKNANSAGNAPEKQVRKITDYVSATGAFVVDAFGAAVEENDLVLILHESVVAIGRDDADNIIATTNVVPNADGSQLERLEWIQAALAGTYGLASFPNGAAPANDVSLAEVLRDIWDSLRNGTGGSEPGTNRSILDELRGSSLNYNNKNYLAVAADMTSGTWNTVATHELFTVTGAVRMRILAEVTADCTSGGGAATIKLGIEGVTDAFIAATGEDDLDVGEAWIDATPTEKYGNFSSLVFDKVIMAGQDVGFEIEGEAFTQGGITFHCWWEALNSTGAVAAGTGAAL
jgi:hypothetical protein